MAAAIFPAYLLARLRRHAGRGRYFAAVATIAAPALSYSPILVEEPWAYPAATLALWLTVRAIDRPGARIARAGRSARVCSPCSFRSQLAALLGALALRPADAGLAVGVDAALADHVDGLGLCRRSVRSRSAALIAIVAFLGHRSSEWEVAATPGRTGWSSTAAGRAARSRSASASCPRSRYLRCSPSPRRSATRPGVRAFVVVSGRRRRELRLVRGDQGRLPLDAVLEPRRRAEPRLPGAPCVRRDRVPPRARRGAGLGGARRAAPRSSRMVLCVPIDRGLDNFPYYEAHGLSILALANREWAWPLGRIETAIVSSRSSRSRSCSSPARVFAARRSSRTARRRRGCRARVEPDRRGLRRDRRARLLRAGRGEPPQAERLGRPRCRRTARS